MRDGDAGRADDPGSADEGVVVQGGFGHGGFGRRVEDADTDELRRRERRLSGGPEVAELSAESGWGEGGRGPTPMGAALFALDSLLVCPSSSTP